MIKKANNRLSVIGLIALCLVNFAYMADMAVVPAADAIFADFADAPVGVLNFILTGPQLIGIFSAILMTFLMKKVDKRGLILSMFALFCLVACTSTLIHSAYYLAVMRALTGFTGGGITTVALALIHEISRDDKGKCEQYEGVFNGCCALAGAIMSMAAGILCTGGWTHAFYVYYAAVPMLFLMLFAIPKTETVQESYSADEKTGASEKMNMGRVIPLLLSLLVLNIFAMMMSYQASIYIAETQLGTSVLSGAVSSVYTIATAVACMGCAPIYAKLGRKMAPLIYALMTLAYLGCSVIKGPVWLCAFVSLLGIAYGFAQTYFIFYAPNLVPSSGVSTVIGWILAANGLGAFLCTYASTFFTSALGVSSLKELCLVYAVCLAAGCALSVLLAVRNQKEHTN